MGEDNPDYGDGDGGLVELMKSFTEMNISEAVLVKLRRLGIDTATPVQEKAIPVSKIA